MLIRLGSDTVDRVGCHTAGETPDVWAEAAVRLDEVRAVLERKHGSTFTWRQEFGADRPEGQIVRSDP
jgi:hypothetical protein